MTKPDLNRLVELARRDRPPAAALEAMASRLQVPLAIAPVAALVLPSSALASALTKLGLSRAALFGWGMGAAAVTGTAFALSFTLSGAPAPVASPPSETRSARPIVTPSPPPVAATSTEDPPAPSSPEPRKPREVSTAWDEPQLIERARKALGSDPKRALVLMQEYQRRFPNGALRVERDVIVLEALARSGHTAEARRRALAFETQHPSSIHLPRVRALLARLNEP